MSAKHVGRLVTTAFVLFVVAANSLESPNSGWIMQDEVLPEVRDEGPTWVTPDPRLAVTPQNDRVRVGHISVKLVPGEPESPLIEIGVKLVSAAKDPKNAPVLLVHCGGPGTDKDCVHGFARFNFADRYNLLGVDQRGISSSKPNFQCDASTFHKPAKTAEFPFKVSDFSSCDCAQPDGTPLVGGCFSDTGTIGQGTFVEQATRLTRALETRNRKCYNSKKFKIEHKGRVYNYLDYAGTRNLAWDIEEIRKAVGAKKMNLLGISYGTAVVGTYASLFPHNTGKLVMDSTMPPDQDTETLGKGALRANEQVLEYVERLCTAFPHICPWERAVSPHLRGLLKGARTGHFTARTVKGTSFHLSPGLLTNFIQKCVTETKSAKKQAQKCLPQFDTLLNGNQKRKEEVVSEILDQYCSYKSENGITASWKEHGFCAGGAQFGLGKDPFLPDMGVMGVDLAGRYSAVQAAKIVARAAETYPSGATAMLGCFAGLATWRTPAIPIGTIGRPDIEAVVFGNLFDQATPYRWSQRMHSVFSKGPMVTFQGAGHSILDEAEKGETGGCQQILEGYIMKDKLPQNGHICYNPTLVALPTQVLAGKRVDNV